MATENKPAGITPGPHVNHWVYHSDRNKLARALAVFLTDFCADDRHGQPQVDFFTYPNEGSRLDIGVSRIQLNLGTQATELFPHRVFAEIRELFADGVLGGELVVAREEKGKRGILLSTKITLADMAFHMADLYRILREGL